MFAFYDWSVKFEYKSRENVDFSALINSHLELIQIVGHTSIWKYLDNKQYFEKYMTYI